MKRDYIPAIYIAFSKMSSQLLKRIHPNNTLHVSKENK
jgi:hypothetical protein